MDSKNIPSRMEHIVLLPLMDKKKIHTVICELDDVFPHSVVHRSEFDELVDKIANRALVIVAYNGKSVVGFCAVYMNDFIHREAYITLFAVKAQYQNKHVGTILLQYIKQIAAINGITKIRLEVEKENLKAIGFYKKNNFKLECQASIASNYMICLL